MMKIGCSLIVRGNHATRENIRAMAERAEALDFDSVWASDHIIIPPRVTSTYPGSATGLFPDYWLERYFEPMAVLNYVSGCTERVQLGTSVLILPMRNPIEVAKEIAGADVLSGGRILFGVGVGWFKEEFDVLREPFHERGRRADEYLQICKALWTEEPASFAGKYYQFKEANFGPKPDQQPHPPILIAGHSEAAMRRAVRFGNGWHPFGLTPDELEPLVEKFHGVVREEGRSLAEIEITLKARLRFGESPDPQPHTSGSPEQVLATVQRYQALGVAHLILDFIPETIDNAMATLDCFAREVRPCLTDTPYHGIDRKDET